MAPGTLKDEAPIFLRAQSKVRQANHDEDYAEPYQDLAEYARAALMLDN
jgi:hypothetical protein